jgi:anti-sigma factor (TIGR02949 family)
MNCALALRMLEAYVDDELDATTAAEMEVHLASCPACTELHGKRAAMKAALRATSLQNVAPAGLRKSILRGIERLEQSGTPSRSLRWWQALVLGSSTAVLGAIGGWWLAQPWAPETLPEVAVSRHVASLTPAGPRIDVASSDRHVVRPWFQGRLEFAPMVRDLSAQGFDLLGARLDRVGDKQAVAIVYRLHSHVINVFSWRASRNSAESEREATVRGFHVVTWRDRDMEFAAVSDTDSTELKRFTVAYRAP